MLRRASSSLVFCPATTCASVCGGAAGVSRVRPVTTRVLGRRGGCARRGATTSISGSAVTPLSAGAAATADEGAGAGVGVAAGVCDNAGPAMQSISETAPQPAKTGFTSTDIILILKAAVQFVVDEFEEAPAVAVRRI